MQLVAIKNFRRAMRNSSREDAFRIISGLDVFTDRHMATPYRDSESGDSGAAASQKQAFTVALGASSTYKLFGLGVVSGSGKAEISTKELTTGGATDLDDDGWNATANNASASGSTSFDLFIYYKKTALIYGAKGGTQIWAYDPDGSSAFDEDIITTSGGTPFSYTHITQGIVHSKDDILYIPYDNKIAKNNNGTWTTAALTLPSSYRITSICERGNYIAIAMAPLSGVGNSRVFLWDRDSSLATLADTMDWGEGILKVLEEIDGILVGASLLSDSTRITNRVAFRYYNGTSAKVFETFTSTSTIVLSQVKQVAIDRVYFLMSIAIDGTTLEGVWAITHEAGTLAITHEKKPNNDTLLTSAGVLKSFYIVGDYTFISYVNASSAYALSKTSDTAAYLGSTLIQTTINQDMPDIDRHKKKKMYAMAVSYDPLPTGGQVVLKYRVDGGAWQTVFTATTAGEIITERAKASTKEFKQGREYEWQAIGTGGAKITGIYYRYDTLPTTLSEN